MLTIEEIKQIPPDCKEMPTNPTLKATALEVGEIEAGQGKTKAKFFCILADNTGAILCTVYKDNEKQKFGMQHHLDIHGRFSCRFGAACLISSGIINPLHILISQ
jgi:hypothetical protein